MHGDNRMRGSNILARDIFGRGFCEWLIFLRLLGMGECNISIRSNLQTASDGGLLFRTNGHFCFELDTFYSVDVHIADIEFKRKQLKGISVTVRS